jgi:UDP-glucuronate decarboxylase
VYAAAAHPPFDESAIGASTPLHPRASYIEGKRAGEAACAAFRAAGAHATAIRLGDVYGPGTRPHDERALNSFIERALTEGRIRLRDGGAAARTYCYVTDAVELMWTILFEGKEIIYNVGGRSRTTIAELARMIGRIAGVDVEFPHTSSDVAGAPRDLALDLARVDQEFGKTAYVTLEAGLTTTIKWQRQLYSALSADQYA